MGEGYEKERSAGVMEQKEGGNKRRGTEKRINREQVLCQRWDRVQSKREDTLPGGCISLGIPREERVLEGGWFILELNLVA